MDCWTYPHILSIWKMPAQPWGFFSPHLLLHYAGKIVALQIQKWFWVHNEIWTLRLRKSDDLLFIPELATDFPWPQLHNLDISWSILSFTIGITCLEGAEKKPRKASDSTLPWIQGNLGPISINKINFVNHFIITFGKVKFCNIKGNYYIFAFCKFFYLFLGFMQHQSPGNNSNSFRS